MRIGVAQADCRVQQRTAYQSASIVRLSIKFSGTGCAFFLNLLFLMAVCISAGAAGKADQDWEEAKVLAAKGKDKQAIVLFTAAIRRNPKNGWAYYDRGYSYSRLGQADLAINDWQRSMAIVPNAETAHRLGKEYVAKNDAGRAIACFTEALHLDPKHQWAHLDRGKLYEELGENGRAINDYRQSIQINTGDPWAPWHLGKLLHGQEQFDQALKLYDRAIQLEKREYWFYFDRGRTEVSLGKFSAALKDFDKAIAMDPARPHGVHARAKLYADMNETQKALADYQLLIDKLDRNPEHPKAWAERAHLYEKLGDYKHAFADYSVVILREPGERAYLGRAKAAIKLGQYKTAISDYSDLLELTSADSDTFTARGDVYLLDKQYGKAIVDFTRSIDMDPKFASRAYQGRALAYEKLGKKQQAADDRNKAMSLKGN